MKNIGITQSQFNPLNLGSILTCWLDSTDPAANGVVPSVSTAISIWKDKSGFGNNWSQATGADQFTYTSDKGMLASGAQYMTGPLPATLGIQNSNFEIILVAKPTSTATMVPVSSAASPIGQYEIIVNATSPTSCAMQFLANRIINAAGTNSVFNNNKTIYDGQASNTQSVTIIENTPNGSSTNTVSSNVQSASNNTMYIGARGDLSIFFTGTIYQLFIFKAVLTTLQRSLMFSYLTNKLSI